MLNGPLSSFYKKKKALFTYLYKYFNSVIEICYSFDASNSSNLFTRSLYNSSSVLVREDAENETIPGSVLDRKYEILGMKDLYLGL